MNGPWLTEVRDEDGNPIDKDLDPLLNAGIKWPICRSTVYTCMIDIGMKWIKCRRGERFGCERRGRGADK